MRISSHSFSKHVLPKRLAGLAIGMILLAVLLLAAISVAIAIGVRSTASNSGTDADRTFATTIVNQASALQRAVDDFHRQGIETCQLDFWIPGAGLNEFYIYDPAYSSAPLQIAPVAALNDPSQAWKAKWTTCWGTIYEPGIGTATDSYEYGYYGVILPDLKPGVCAQINKVLYGSTTITVSTDTFNTWTNPGNTTVSPGNSNQPAACFRTSDGKFIFYSIVDLHQRGDPPY